MSFELSLLPYEKNALEPYISEKTLEFHYGKHHRTYVENLNKLISGSEFATMSLEAIIQATAGKAEYIGIFNNAAQAWNHAFFWKCMKKGGGKPQGTILARLEKDFGISLKDKAAYVAGHSLGEYSAACAAGVFSLSDTAVIVTMPTPVKVS